MSGRSCGSEVGVQLSTCEQTARRRLCYRQPPLSEQDCARGAGSSGAFGRRSRHPRNQRRTGHMRRLAIIALMLNVGAAATYAQQHGSKTALSGTAAASTIDLGTGTPTTEYNLEGNSSLGSFTFRTVSSGAAPSNAPSSCSGGNKLYIPVAAGMGVL